VPQADKNKIIYDPNTHPLITRFPVHSLFFLDGSYSFFSRKTPPHVMIELSVVCNCSPKMDEFEAVNNISAA